jgi:uncharacterized protein YeaO (DUF488 family)
MTGDVSETYAAALQHDLHDPGDATLVGVVRRPPGWFHGAVDENHRELGPPEALLEETKQRQEEFEVQGMCTEGAHNAAWEETRFADRYRAYLDDADEAAAALADLAARVHGGEDLTLVCFEGEDKRCHRHLLLERLRDRL